MIWPYELVVLYEWTEWRNGDHVDLLFHTKSHTCLVCPGTDRNHPNHGKVCAVIDGEPTYHDTVEQAKAYVELTTKAAAQ